MLRGFLATIGIGAGLMYFYDPQMGRRRRAGVQDKWKRIRNDASRASGVVSRDLSNRTRGWIAGLRSLFNGHEGVPDDVLEARIRSKIGRISSHPSAIEVSVHQGRARLAGPVLAEEVEQVFNAARSIRGVQHVDNAMDVHQEPGNIPALQGGQLRSGERFDLFQDNWSPSTEFLIGAAGGGLVLLGMLRGAPASSILGAVALGFLGQRMLQEQSQGAGDLGGGSRQRMQQTEQTQQFEPTERVELPSTTLSQPSGIVMP